MSSVIHTSAKIGQGTTHGECCVIGANVQIGKGCQLGNFVVIYQ